MASVSKVRKLRSAASKGKRKQPPTEPAPGSSTKHGKTSKRRTFTDLPTEIRFSIYRHVFADAPIGFSSHSKRQQSSNSPIGILLACRTTFADTRAFAFRHTMLHLDESLFVQRVMQCNCCRRKGQWAPDGVFFNPHPGVRHLQLTVEGQWFMGTYPMWTSLHADNGGFVNLTRLVVKWSLANHRRCVDDMVKYRPALRVLVLIDSPAHDCKFRDGKEYGGADVLGWSAEEKQRWLWKEACESKSWKARASTRQLRHKKWKDGAACFGSIPKKEAGSGEITWNHTNVYYCMEEEAVHFASLPWQNKCPAELEEVEELV